MGLQKETSIARICLLFTNLSWYLFLILGILAPVTFLLAYMGELPSQLDFKTILPLNPDMINISSAIDQSAIAIDSADAKLNISYFAQHFPDAFITWACFAIILLGFVLVGLFQLKKLLRTVVEDNVFSRKNINRIKIIAVLIFLVDPLGWMYHNIFFEALFSDPAATGMEISFTGPAFNYWFIGLLIYTLAVIFDKGHEMYQELKLTV